MRGGGGSPVAAVEAAVLAASMLEVTAAVPEVTGCCINIVRQQLKIIGSIALNKANSQSLLLMERLIHNDDMLLCFV